MNKKVILKIPVHTLQRIGARIFTKVLLRLQRGGDLKGIVGVSKPGVKFK